MAAPRTLRRKEPARLRLTAIAASLLAIQAWGDAAWAVAECGSGPAPVCDPALNPYGTIQYFPSTDFHLTVPSDIIVDASLNGIRVDSAGALSESVRLDLHDGARIRVTGFWPLGVRVTAPGDITIDSGADIELISSNPAAPPNAATGLQAYSFVDGRVTINQRAGSRIKTEGRGAFGIGGYRLLGGGGSINLITAGDIEGTHPTDLAYGVVGLVMDPTTQADINIVQAQSGRITLNGNEAVGVYAAQAGVGHGNNTVTVQGSISTVANNNAIAALSTTVSGNPGRSTIVVGPTATLHAQAGAVAYGVQNQVAGLGEGEIVSSGRISVDAPFSQGLALSIESPNNAADGRIRMLGGQVRASGANPIGILLRKTGTGTASAWIASGTTVHAEGTTGTPVGLYAYGTPGGAMPARVNVQAQVDGTVIAQGQFGIGARVVTAAGTASLAVGAGGRVSGGWQADPAGTSVLYGLPAAGVVMASNSAATLENAGHIEAGSDRAVLDQSRYVAGVGRLTLRNSGTITGFLELGGGGQNRVTNQAGGVMALRHFADTDGDGTRDTKRVAVSDFGAPNSRFGNQAGATLRLAPVAGSPAVDAAGYYTPTTGAGGTPLPGAIYDMARAGIVQGQLVRLGEFRNAGTIDLRGPAVGNTLLMTSAASAGVGPGTGLFVADGGSLRVQVGKRPGDAGLYSDMLIVDRTQVGAGGPTRVQVDYDPAQLGGLSHGNGIQVVEVRDKAHSAAGAFALGNPVASGAYEYALQRGGLGADAGDGNWYLRNTVAGPAGQAIPNYRKEVPVAMAVPGLVHRLGLQTLGTYHDRSTGALADGASPQPSLAAGPRAWGRLFGSTGHAGRTGTGASSRYSAFKEDGPRYEYDLAGMQLGLDAHRQLRQDGSGSTAGAYLGVSNASARVDAVLGGRAGRVSVNGYSLGGYWTHVGASGAYIEPWRKSRATTACVPARSTASASRPTAGGPLHRWRPACRSPWADNGRSSPRRRSSTNTSRSTARSATATARSTSTMPMPGPGGWARA